MIRKDLIAINEAYEQIFFEQLIEEGSLGKYLKGAAAGVATGAGLAGTSADATVKIPPPDPEAQTKISAFFDSLARPNEKGEQVNAHGQAVVKQIVDAPTSKWGALFEAFMRSLKMVPAYTVWPIIMIVLKGLTIKLAERLDTKIQAAQRNKTLLNKEVDRKTNIKRGQEEKLLKSTPGYTTAELDLNRVLEIKTEIEESMKKTFKDNNMPITPPAGWTTKLIQSISKNNIFPQSKLILILSLLWASIYYVSNSAEINALWQSIKSLNNSSLTQVEQDILSFDNPKQALAYLMDESTAVSANTSEQQPQQQPHQYTASTQQAQQYNRPPTA